MNTTHTKLVAGDHLDANREVIRLSLDEIAVEVETALRDASLDFPLFFVIPNSGNAILAIATSLDPPDTDWAQASSIVCRFVGEKLGGIKLGSHRLQCAVANANFEAADVITEPAIE